MSKKRASPFTPLVHLEAAVHVDDLAGDEAGEGRGEEEHGVRALLRPAEAMHRYGLQQLCPLLRAELLHDHRRHDVARRDAVDCDAVRRELACEAEGEADQRRLRGRVRRARCETCLG